MNSPDNAGNKWFIVFLIPRPVGIWTLFVWSYGCGKSVSLFCGFWNPFLCLASVGSRSVGFLPSPTVRLDFGSNWYLEEENLGYTYIQLFGTCFNSKVFRKKSWLAFLPSIWSPIVSNYSNTLNIDVVIPALCVHMEFHSVCVCVYWG